MTSKNIFYLRIALGIITLILSYRIYRIIMQPIEFASIKEKRYEEITNRLEQLREAQLIFKSEYNQYANNFDDLVSFLQNAQVSIIERKDSSFMRYDKIYQTDMLKDTIIYRIIGQTSARDKLISSNPELFKGNFSVSDLRYIPFAKDSTEFSIATGHVDRNGVRVQVFEIKAPNTDFFHDIYDDYESLILGLRINALAIGSLTEPTLSGNWK
ncbi:MAG: hypothetical protein CL856_07195 [Cryomorphaceae bacterium]|nr:hypothetical protein [Cryomorphaceae bacterium]